jgi:hypothetical protein
MASRVAQVKPPSMQVQARRLPEAGFAARRPQAYRQPAAPGPGGLPWSFSGMPMLAPEQAGSAGSRLPGPAASLPWPLQPKLQIGAAADPLEQEADHVAEQVMRMPDPGSVTTASDAGMLRRKCACGGTPGPTGECAACRATRLRWHRPSCTRCCTHPDSRLTAPPARSWSHASATTSAGCGCIPTRGRRRRHGRCVRWHTPWVGMSRSGRGGTRRKLGKDNACWRMS